ILGFADTVVVSLAKDFCVSGGLIATNDASLWRTLQDRIQTDGCGLDVIGKKIVALALRHRKYLEVQGMRRRESVQRIWSALREQGIQVVQPAGAHCVLIDVNQIPELKGFAHPVASFLAWLYLNTGIRGAAHNPGMQKGTAINNLTRLAIPVGLKREQV